MVFEICCAVSLQKNTPWASRRRRYSASSVGRSPLGKKEDAEGVLQHCSEYRQRGPDCQDQEGTSPDNREATQAWKRRTTNFEPRAAEPSSFGGSWFEVPFVLSFLRGLKCSKERRCVMREFEGRVAVVTGAASGMGKAFAERFAQEGMKVVLARLRGGCAGRCGQRVHAEGVRCPRRRCRCLEAGSRRRARGESNRPRTARSTSSATTPAWWPIANSDASVSAAESSSGSTR